MFTHLVDDAWAAWLLELHRVLAADGILIATSLGSRHSAHFAKERWEEDRIGMNALRHWRSWDAGGPVVLHSTWWLRAHWGRAFEILEIDEAPVMGNHRWLAMRKRDVTLTIDDLERPEPGEPRELTAMRHHARQLRGELERSREQERLLRAMLGSRAFAVAERLSRLRQRGRPVLSRQQVRRALKPLPGMKGRGSGALYLRWLVELADLTPDAAVLEPGCGTGRMAEPLAGYLSATGSYDGFDVVRKAIKWCEANIQSPNFRFRHVDVRNRYYNPEGRLDPEAFEFPYPAEAFDLVFLTSVFTHMLPPEVRHYLSEIRRVLRPQGRCLMTFFLLNEDSGRAGPPREANPNAPSRTFAYEGDGYRYDVAESPEAAVGYRERDVLGFLEQAGFEVHVPIRYGVQDIVVVSRRD